MQKKFKIILEVIKKGKDQKKQNQKEKNQMQRKFKIILEIINKRKIEKKKLKKFKINIDHMIKRKKHQNLKMNFLVVGMKMKKI